MASSDDTKESTIPAPAVPWRAGWITDVGRRRDHNEDAVGGLVAPQEARLAQRGALYVVADGMGGHSAGEVASRIALETTLEAYLAAPASLSNPVALRQAIQQANTRTLQKSLESPDMEGMGTTLVAAVVQRDGTLVVANVGDSRAYLVREGRATKLSVDHTWVAEQVAAGILTADEAKVHRRRHVITRALGRRPEVEIALSTHRLLAGEALVLCSDGLSDVVEDHELALYAVQGEPQEAAQALMHLANERGGPDNISVLIVRYAGLQDAKVRAPRAAWPLVVAIGVPLTLIAVAVALVLLGILKNPFASQPAATPEQSPALTATPSQAGGTPTPSETPAPASTQNELLGYSTTPEPVEPALADWPTNVQNDSGELSRTCAAMLWPTD